ncbi:hypothetical protein [Nocardia sp. NPDC058480]|uniref:hypothetical protein n=1 Tax=Nocardia sp. NPDC058480 TaxID=3346522 RepID=UPI0036620B27
MSTDSQSERHGHDGFAEFTEELRLLSEVLLARVEPVLRRTAADGRADLGGCAWCPVCAAAALVRGDHHDVVAALAEHGTSMVTVLREALAGIPVEPVLPPEWTEHAAAHPNSTDGPAAAHGPATEPTGQPPRQDAATGLQDPGSSPRRGATHADQSGVPRPRRVDEYTAPRATRTPHITPEPDRTGAAANASGTDAFADNPSQRRRPAPEDRSAPRAPRSQYVDIPVTIRG